LWAFSNAGGIISSQLWGKKDHDGFNKSCGATISVSMIAGIILSLIIFFASSLLARIMIDDEEVVKYVADYLRIISVSFIFTSFNIAIATVFSSSGDTKTPFIQQAVTTILNFILNYLLIFGAFGFPRLTVVGAAISTLISVSTGSIVLVFLAISKGKMPSLIYLIKPEIKVIKEMLHLGLPMLGDMFFWQFAMMVYLKFIGMAGADAVAIYGVVGIFISVLYLSISGFVSGTGIIVGQLIGGGLKGKAYKFSKSALFYSILISLIPSILLILFSGIIKIEPYYITIKSVTINVSKILDIPSWFRLSGVIGDSATICLIILAFRQAFTTISGMVGSTIRAGKDALFVLYISLFGFFLVGLPLTTIAGPVFNLGIVGIFIAISIEDIAKAITFLIRFRSKSWLFKSDIKAITE